MDLLEKILYFISDLILPLAVGYYLRCKNWDRKLFDQLMVITMLGIYPLLALLSFWKIKLVFDLMWLPVLGVVMQVIPGLCALARVNKYACSLDKGSYMMAAILSNTLTIGGLVVFILFGEIGFAYTQLTLLLNNVILFLFCFPLAQYYYNRHDHIAGAKFNWRKIILNRNQIAILGVLAGVLLNYYEMARPDYFNLVFNLILHTSAWTALLPIGFSLDFSKIKQYLLSTLDLIGIKFIVTPLLLYCISRLVIQDQIMIKTLIVLASTPTAIVAVLTVKIHNLNINLAMAAFMLTTIIYLAVVCPLTFIVL